MTRIHDVRLELVRPGPPHNQLLSPLTPYMALCGGGSPVTFHIDFEHRQLLNRLERLRYVTQDGRGGYDAVPDRLREAEVRDLGEGMGRVLARIPSLNAELSRASSGAPRVGSSEFVHVRLVLSGSELSVLPFELARAPQSFPGEGLDLCLQGSLPVVVTREIRRSRPLPTAWCDREPKVLCVFAEPGGLSVPKTHHIRVLRRAVRPWVKWPQRERIQHATGDSESDPYAHVKKRLRVIADASIEDIYDMCARENFTHVHILAHGDHYEEAGEQRFGVALAARGRPETKRVVNGEQLAKAIRAEDEQGVSRSDPLVVTLAICDSGQQGSLLVPGGSIAHDLHTAGIPWVFASQFPLTKRGSVRLSEFLYPRLLRGDDPRQVLYEARRRLSMSTERNHDWASIVTYASLESDFERQVAIFFENQTRRAIEVQMSRADDVVQHGLAGSDAEAMSNEVKTALDTARRLLDRWEQRIPEGQSLEERTTRANCFGMKGSTLKRIGLLHAALDDEPEAQSLAKTELKTALEAYREAMDQWVTEEARFNWTASQYLALSAVLRADRDPGTLAVCRRLAERDLYGDDRGLQAWAHATLAELSLISLFHDDPSEPGELDEKQRKARRQEVEDAVVDHCRNIVVLMGPDSFHVKSTRRQFQRYADRWRLSEKDWGHPVWSRIAQAAVETLNFDVP